MAESHRHVVEMIGFEMMGYGRKKLRCSQGECRLVHSTSWLIVRDGWAFPSGYLYEPLVYNCRWYG